MDGVTGPLEVASGALSEESIVSRCVSPDARCSASGAPDLVYNGWPALGLDGEYLYSTSSMGALLPIRSVENHLVVQERSKNLERIEI